VQVLFTVVYHDIMSLLIISLSVCIM